MEVAPTRGPKYNAYARDQTLAKQAVRAVAMEENHRARAQPPTLQPPQSIDSSVSAVEGGSANAELVFDPPPAPPPTPEQKLDFLHYLVKRGIVNEGFAEGRVPEQYKKNR